MPWSLVRTGKAALRPKVTASPVASRQPADMRLLLLLALVMAAALAPTASSAELNSICRDGAVAWRCKSIDTCSTLEKDDTIQICGFNGKPLVCCPPANSNFVPRVREPSNNSRNSSSRN